jgi:two-component system CheB/CheR fusion protein
LAEAYDYADALFDTVRKSVLLLTKDLRVKTANQTFYHTFQLREEETEGILIYELDNRHWNIPQLRKMLEELLQTNTPVHGLEIKYQFHKIGERIVVINAAKVIQKVNRQQVIFLTIDDITEQREAQKKINEMDALLHALAENVPVLTWVNGTNKRRHFFSKLWLEFTGRNLEQEQGDGWLAGMHKEDVHGYLKTFNKSFEERKPYTIEYRLQRKDGIYQLVKEEGRPVFTADGIFSGYTGSCTPVS